MKQSIRRSVISSSQRAFVGGMGLLVAAVFVPACGGPEGSEEIAAQTGAIVWTQSPFQLAHDYLFFTAQLQNAAAADGFCARSGGTLVAINSSAAQGFVKNEISLHGGGTWLIGYSDSATEGLWQWADGSSNGFVNWAPGQPVNATGNEDCAVMDASSGLWSAVDCGGAYTFVCERGTGLAVSQGTFTYNASNTNFDTQGYTSFAVNVTRGLIVGTCGLPNASNSGDTYLRVFDQNGVQITSNDDACGASNLGSNITIDINGCVFGCTYVIHAGCYFNANCGGTVSYQHL